MNTTQVLLDEGLVADAVDEIYFASCKGVAIWKTREVLTRHRKGFEDDMTIGDVVNLFFKKLF